MPRREKTPPRDTDLFDVVVRLKPILGVRPGVYLTALYVLAVLLILFFVLFYPGLHRRGSYLVFSGAPDRATVLIDGRYGGSAPCTLFVAKGSHRIRVTKPFYSMEERVEAVPGRVFATLLVPQRTTFSYHLGLVDAQGLFDWALDDFARNPIIPEIISKTVSEVLSSYAGDVPQTVRANLSVFLNNAMFFVINDQQMREILGARADLAAHGGFSSQQNLIGFVEQIEQLQGNYDNFPAWMILAASKESSKKLLATPWASAYAARYLEAIRRLSLEPAPAVSGGSLSVSGVNLRPIPPGTLLMGRDDVESTLGKSIDQLMAHAIDVGRCFIAETEVTNRQFQAFVDAVPEWRPSNKDVLLSTGLVSEGYLSTWSEDRFPAGGADLPVTGVSWHAASAYCAWLQAKLTVSRPGAVVRLPTEAEWEWAARGGLRGKPYPAGDKPGRSVFYADGIAGPAPVGTSEPNGYGLRDMAGNVWEWCADSYAPALYLLSSLDPQKNRRIAAALPETSEKVVRGGSWGNQKELLRVYTRGSQPADWCTPQLGFRPAATIP
jgi:iron(II)-dependent oxidoreductase